jgi:ribosomal protein S8
MKTFVYDGTEVRKTGRIAVRQIKLAGGKTRDMTIYEITPVADFDWKKWVPDEQLYEVQEGTDANN